MGLALPYLDPNPISNANPNPNPEQVYADMSRSVREYADDERSMIQLVFAPVTPEAGADRNWLKQTDEQIIDATLEELGRLFPQP